VRAREYVDSGLCSFEVKLKGTRGRTVKRRMSYDPGLGHMTAEAMSFLTESVERLQRAGVRLEPACSKYCLGIGLLRPEERVNAFRPLLRRHFDSEPTAAPAPAAAAHGDASRRHGASAPRRQRVCRSLTDAADRLLPGRHRIPPTDRDAHEPKPSPHLRARA